MQFLVAKQAQLMEGQLRLRLVEIDRAFARLTKERERVQARLAGLQAARTPTRTPRLGPAVSCPRCGRDRDFLTQRGGYLGHVLEDPSDTDDLEAGKPLFCPACGEVFLYGRVAVATVKRP